MNFADYRQAIIAAHTRFQESITAAHDELAKRLEDAGRAFFDPGQGEVTHEPGRGWLTAPANGGAGGGSSAELYASGGPGNGAPADPYDTARLPAQP